ncbi:hypothetical protein TELCIR_00321 [Teladorsagia circumcincta]|uniref:Uncharacterized protein n=1 Tax=Teladorsagia circumcincta TaxID=45464 RepID=A0A2G9V501_TELCI|nr:hypothetical protein TELCIR_00321 [Teladorsagia circumcincta]
MGVRIDTKDGYWTILSAYAPRTGCHESEKDEIYLGLDHAIRSVSEGDHLIIAFDLNGHVDNDRRGLESVQGVFEYQNETINVEQSTMVLKASKRADEGIADVWPRGQAVDPPLVKES